MQARVTTVSLAMDTFSRLYVCLKGRFSSRSPSRFKQHQLRTATALGVVAGELVPTDPHENEPFLP
jgi:hypothetical protein